MAEAVVEPRVEPVYQRLRAWRGGQLLLDTHRATSSSPMSNTHSGPSPPTT